ncbi:hypothetical protein C3B44_10425 [Corynebacterium yudongzhengii]|uniref:Uncharacterized protein n=1 Tax=Corynebacterium yudongzhengii TaxID=2080740 RepID=A0A2U1T4S3_9CORY|nr:hypothetical protein [Corynebacterium yudongzhengii]AWB82698.1 hypothetical protein C3B44_10425 [Corynebacterium yudongzhengii]PWC00999.1 hypothetical protein DF222_09685 [Corynebacterium yudongzhengii]
MAYVILLLAVLFLLAAGVLMFVDHRRRSAEETPAEEEPTQEPQPEQDEDSRPRSSGIQLPGATRRERRQWAEAKGFDFSRRDDYLVDEWTRGAAATGAAARDIVSGNVYNHEMLLMDLGGTNVMAMRTGANSGTVLDFRRDGEDLGEGSVDLVEVETVSGFRAFGTDAGVLQRALDVRIRTALENLPEAVTAVWFESDWVLAQTTRGSRAEDWEEMLAPLALLADAARVLPPLSEAGMALPLQEHTPSRRMPTGQLASLEAHTETQHPEDDGVPPKALRPDEPVQLPSRTRADARGVVTPRALGGDEVDAIADGRPGKHRADDTRVLRDLSEGPTIFEDRDED